MGGILGFFLSPLGKAVAVIALLAAWTIYQRDQAADRAREECQAEQLQKTVDELLRQRDVAQQALADAEKQQVVTDREMAVLEAERNDILKQLAEQKIPSCRIPDDIRKRLHDIR